MLKFSHMGVSCSDIGITEQFYKKHFGFERARSLSLGNGKYIIFMKNGNAYLELFKSEKDRPIPQAEEDGQDFPGWRHIAFQVDDIEAKLLNMGTDAIITKGPHDFSSFIPGWKTVWVKDPDGNIVEISQGYKDP